MAGFVSILLLCIASGCAALIYEIVWFQTLELVIGASAASLAVLLTAFMGGMFAGSVLAARRASASRHPLREFAAIEAAVGACGAVLLVVMPLVARLYTAMDGGGPSSMVLRALACLLLLLPPAALMGATLPTIARHFESTPAGNARIGLVYGGNILGGVVGCVAAGFYLLPRFDLSTAAFTAIFINAMVAVGAFALSARVPRVRLPSADADGSTFASDVPVSGAPLAVHVSIALSGFTALAAEVIWTRLLSLLFGATTYAFSIILAALLAGLAGGSAGAAALLRRPRPVNARALLGWAQAGLTLALAYGAWMATRQLPYWPVDTSLPPAAALNPATDLARAFLTVLPAALLWGASVPVAIAAAVRPTIDIGTALGQVYAANTAGAVAGAVLASVVFIPAIGTQGTHRLLIVIAALSALVVWVGGRSAGIPSAFSDVPRNRSHIPAYALLVTGAVVLAATVSPPPPGLIAWGRLLPWHGEPAALYVGEGVNASIAVTEESNGWRNFHVSGKVEASTEPQDMRLQRLLGHLGALMHDEGPKRVLVVGFGAGVTAGALSIHPSVERMVICELEPLIPRVVSKYFADANYDVATDLKVNIVYDDARHYVLTSRETFDVITSDPIHPWVKGAATLYTREYFDSVRKRLSPGGVVTQWVPLYESTEDSVRSVIATFLQVFPDGTIWRNDDASGRGYDAVLVGRVGETPIDVDAWQRRIDRPEYRRVHESLAEVGYESAIDVLGTYLGRGRDLGSWLAGASINTDRSLRLQYLAGLGLNNNLGTEIRSAILRYQRFPEDLFTGEPATVSRLQARLQPPEAP